MCRGVIVYNAVHIEVSAHLPVPSAVCTVQRWVMFGHSDRRSSGEEWSVWRGSMYIGELRYLCQGVPVTFHPVWCPWVAPGDPRQDQRDKQRRDVRRRRRMSSVYTTSVPEISCVTYLPATEPTYLHPTGRLFRNSNYN